MSITTYNLTLDLQRAFHQVLVMKEGDHNSRKGPAIFSWGLQY